MLRIMCYHKIKGLSCHTNSYLQQEQAEIKAAHLLLRSHVVICSLILSEDICISAEGSCLAWVWISPILMQVRIPCS